MEMMGKVRWMYFRDKLSLHPKARVLAVRDLPVFREIVGEHAFYFQGMSAKELAQFTQAWLKLFESGEHPTSMTMPWLTWEESAKQLQAVLI